MIIIDKFCKGLTKSIGVLCLLASFTLTAHDEHGGTAKYLGNSAILVQSAQTKVLFDPFFHRDFGIYQLVPEDIRNAIFQGLAPYDKMNYIFISHAHDDHFSAIDLLNYLIKHTKVQLIAPKQAIDKLTALDDFESNAKAILPRVHTITLNYGDMAWSKIINHTKVSAVRIPHAGWPGRANVENMVFRVTLPDGTTVMHMGDADPDDGHYLPYKAHWQKQVTDTAFPPYWFFYSAEGRDILHEIINAKHHVGVHVPVVIPQRLIETKQSYFSTPGQVIKLKTQE
ncbi:MBL fold metallo-hydrolase [Colwellia sp. Arc7-635]|uniref:MBL fold metallo-hydrolase n=1 Tax=Colwellia sp. Arc7-635 TaxID=2497879 RepID=UPI000F857514|nr:MBL fold metallo-hydrolase [Colwellia sp. Arc7-635]AZQ83989.1 MBL fold metallo-hydrolase [Colwellia sp. Arc7-635]